MNIFRKARLILEYLGPGWVAFRLGYALRKRLGLLRRASPRKSWDALSAVAKLPDWLRAPAWPASGRKWGNRCVTEADGISLGEFILFSCHSKHLGVPPDWHRNPFTGQSAPRGLHWSDLGDFDFGDIKTIWEPSRFGWAFTLVRAHARTGEARFAELFWMLFEDWCVQNPPNEGVNWKCGQEATFRLMAVTFAVAEFGRLPSATEDRLKLWSRFVSATGLRIAANLSYALSQSNNHGVSECVGLITAGLIMDNATGSERWTAEGLANLREQLDELIYPDGGFSQHSLVYHRVLLHDLFWLIRLLRSARGDVPDWLLGKTRLAVEFLARVVDESTGGAPLFGTNDGALILPLDECSTDDFRAVVQAGFALLDAQRTYSPGPWDESVFWLTGLDPAAWPERRFARPERWHAATSGFFQWRSGLARCFLICPTRFLHRPGGVDMLHADIWWNGRPVAHDSGSYSYNAPGRFDGAFSLAAAHNVPMLVGREPLQKVSRFLYLPWPRGTADWSDGEKCFRASHDAYGELVHPRRTIGSPVEGGFEVRDHLQLAKSGRIRIHWLLADAGWKLDVATRTATATLDGQRFTLAFDSDLPPTAVSLVRADPNSARGWWSRHYLELEPAVSFELLFDVERELTVTTRFSPGK